MSPVRRAFSSASSSAGCSSCSAAARRRGRVSISGEELASELRLASGVRLRRQLEGAAEVLARAFVLAAAAREHALREQRLSLARRVPDLDADAQRLAEVLLGEIPLPEAVADEPEVLGDAAHARVEPFALVERQRLLEEADGFAPLAEVLVDESQVVERHDEAVGIVDPAVRRAGVLEPLDRRVRVAQLLDVVAIAKGVARRRAVLVGIL